MRSPPGVYQESIHFIRSPSGFVGECQLQTKSALDLGVWYINIFWRVLNDYMSGNFVVSQTTPCRSLPHLWLFYVTCRHHTSRLDCIRYAYHVHTVLEGVIRPGKLTSALLIPCPMLTPIYPFPFLQLPYRHTPYNPSSIHMAHWRLWAFGTTGYLMATTHLPLSPPQPPFAFSQTLAFWKASICM